MQAELEISPEKTNGASEQTQPSDELVVFRSLADHALDGILMTSFSEQPRYTYANRACHDMFGYNYESREMVGLPGDTTWAEEDLPFFAETIVPQVMAGGWRGDVRQKRKDGTRFETNVSVFPIRRADATPAAIAVLIRDITQRKKMEQTLKQSEEMLHNIIDAMPLGMHMYRLDTDGALLLTNANASASHMLGGDVSQFVGKTIEELLPPFTPHETVECFKAAASEGRPWQTEKVIRRGGQIVSGFQVQAFQTTPDNMAAIFIDITERKQAEEERARLQQDVIDAQQAALRELSTPIIPVMEGIIVMPLIGSIDTRRARDITRALLSGVSAYRAKIVIIDITGVAVIDTGVADHLNKTVQAARLKGAQTIISGISDAVAETIVELGIDWGQVDTLRDLQTGLVTAISRLGIELKI